MNTHASPHRPRTIWYVIGALAVIVAAAAAIWQFTHAPAAPTTPELHLLGWVGYEEEDLLTAFTAETGIQVKARTAAGGDAVMALFTAQPTEFDLIILDPEYIQKLAPAGRLTPFDQQSLAWDGYPDVIRRSSTCYYDAKLYGVPLRFGSNGLIFNTTHVSPEEASTYEILWADKVRGKIGIWDWYLPSMGVISLVAGNTDAPYRLNADQLQAVTARLKTLRPRVAAIHSTPRDLLASLAAGDTWIVPTGGEAFAAILRAEGKPIDWSIPREGGIMWMETAIMPATSAHPEVAMKFIRWMQSPTGQALLATRRAYYGVPCNAKAISKLPRDVQDVFHVHDEQELVRLFQSLRIRELPQNQSPTVWQDIWERFKSNTLE